MIEQTGAKDATLVGFSMGGGEVARYMSRHGGKSVVKAARISSVVPYMLKTDDSPEGTDQSVFDKITQGRGIAQSALIEYDGAPHGLFATDMARLTQDFLEFLRRS